MSTVNTEHSPIVKTGRRLQLYWFFQGFRKWKSLIWSLQGEEGNWRSGVLYSERTGIKGHSTYAGVFRCMSKHTVLETTHIKSMESLKQMMNKYVPNKVATHMLKFSWILLMSRSRKCQTQPTGVHTGHWYWPTFQVLWDSNLFACVTCTYLFCC